MSKLSMPIPAILPANSAFQTEFLPNPFTPINPVMAGTEQPDPFHRVFATLLNHTNHTLLQAEQHMTELEAGQDNLIETVMSVQKASQTMNMLIQVRNRIVEGYHETFNQQV
ncbi:flagellar hook-basal body complex protein FliE [Endozoicomonas sp. SCSIO W0465]|uniref:flagellar hook-basal body complex protein FliE n=1 Tax=Endozoicomonas sp. SCSIO W0465 TaxID=2918516 RepID=UPI002074E35C|nr:flagellar hook-basal body complex protein FliE [Endozoicomonas sp. SCSIO W0465]USE38256.1 flagellar hook-basal body complex protein FliE [Endozoicomonas sp. SCSIO W0465]